MAKNYTMKRHTPICLAMLCKPSQKCPQCLFYCAKFLFGAVRAWLAHCLGLDPVRGKIWGALRVTQDDHGHVYVSPSGQIVCESSRRFCLYRSIWFLPCPGKSSRTTPGFALNVKNVPYYVPALALSSHLLFLQLV